ncbi:hypothetical protein Moror_10193 [Moniliophthora roreri MCA 2997]|uniref:Uncharacterized protein n=1 Tax=Moniliophthora roreri (strain MCA 2997) TaxID=1381753 RepID=V2WUX4_MONRO|nr:hypothetical protein Moror_10193 [Moniliophthora roreri MCA 2997]
MTPSSEREYKTEFSTAATTSSVPTPNTESPVASRCPSPTASELAVAYELTQGEDADLNNLPKMPICDHCNQPTDTILRSRTGALIGAHSHQLKSHCPDGLWSLAVSSFALQEPVQTAYETDVIRLLTRWIHPLRPMQTNSLTFDLLKRFAEAVETYRVYCAMESVRLAMMLHIKHHPTAVFAYAVKHNYRDIVQLALPKTLQVTQPEEMRVALADRPDLVIAWLTYRTKCVSEKSHLYNRPPPPAPACDAECLVRWCRFYYTGVVQTALADEVPLTMSQFDRSMKPKAILQGCEGCKQRVKEWRKMALKTISGRESFWEYVHQEQDEEEMF